MSSVRAGPRASKSAAKSSDNTATTTATTKPQKADTSKPDLNKSLPTAEQMRMAQIIDTRTEDPDMKNKIKQVMDATRKSEDEVSTALHDCDNDLDRAVNMLLEGEAQGEWVVTSGNKKKNRQAGAAVVPSSREKDNNRDRSEPGESDRERSRTRGGPPRMRGRGSSDSRGWRGRENKENEKNLVAASTEEAPPRRGGPGGRMMNGPGRSGRGGRGGRSGPRTFQSREKGGGPGFSRPIDTWNPQGEPEPQEQEANGPEAGEQWGDSFPSPDEWDNEEYTGSLADTKVFTPSAAVAEGSPDLAAAASALPSLENAASMLPLASLPASQAGSKSLTPAQSQYFSQLTAQAVPEKTAPANGPKEPLSYVSAVNSSYPSTSYPSPTAYTATTVSYAASTYGTASPSYSSQMKGTVTSASQNLRPKTQRARVPPPSKIPSSAVEMPGDATANSAISFLDVQFGGLEFGSDSFDFTAGSAEAAAKFPAVSESSPAPLDLSSMAKPQQQQQQQQPSQHQQQHQQQTQHQQQQQQAQQQQQQAQQQQVQHQQQQQAQQQQVQHQQQTQQQQQQQQAQQQQQQQQQQAQQQQQQTQQQQQQLENYSVASSQPSSTSQSSQLATKESSISHSQKLSGGDSMTFQAQTTEHKAPPSTGGSSSYSQGVVKTEGTSLSSYPSSTYQQAYQKPSSAAYYSSSNYSQQQQQQQYPSQQSNYQSGYGSQTFPSSPATTAYSQTTGSSSTYHQSGSSYQQSSYPSQQYPQSYAATSYTPATSQYQNSSYGSPATTATSLHSSTAKLASTKDTQYEAPSSTQASLSSSATPTGLQGLVSSSGQPASNTASTKVTSSTAGVPAAMLGQHQYIMGQQGMPYFNVQQPIYGFDDYQHQLMQSRVPMQTASGFYDLSSLAAAGRESGMTSVAYSVSDGRFARTDNNSSPVPSTLSQQNPGQGHQQPMLNPSTLPPGYAYFYGTGVVPGSFQYGTPALYQLPAATNAHGATNSTQYAKPATYSSGYGSGYDSLSGQGAADYSKGSYAGGSSAGQTSKAATASTAGAADLSSNMYGKPHVALGKVNSYDKQGFHSGTPPPFSLPGSQSVGAATAAGYTPLFIPTLAPQLHQPLHQMEFRNQGGRRSDSGSGSGQRSQPPASQQSKAAGVKQAYNTSYWAQN